MTAQREWDIVLFGATGFVGGLTADYLATATPAGVGSEPERPLRWALAGRSREKLEAVRARVAGPHAQEQAGPHAQEQAGSHAQEQAGSHARGEAPAIVIADATDPDAMRALAARARVVVTTVGPYIKYGEPLVAACAEHGTDYVDLSGEPEFVDAMIERYHVIAQQSGAKIVHACGFDSLPHDLGAYFTLLALRARMSDEERAQAPVTIEGFVQVSGGISGGTWHSALGIMASMPAHFARQRRLAGTGRAALLPRKLSYRPELKLWGLPMPTIDPEIVVRSQELLPEYGPLPRYGHYLGCKSLAQAAAVAAGASGLFLVAQLKPARAALGLLRHPGDGPDADARAQGFFRVRFLGRAAGHEVICEVRGGDPGYGETSKMLAESALCLAFDRSRLPPYVGVVPSAAAMGETLIERLASSGIAFSELRGERS